MSILADRENIITICKQIKTLPELEDLKRNIRLANHNCIQFVYRIRGVWSVGFCLRDGLADRWIFMTKDVRERFSESTKKELENVIGYTVLTGGHNLELSILSLDKELVNA